MVNRWQHWFEKLKESRVAVWKWWQYTPKRDNVLLFVFLVMKGSNPAKSSKTSMFSHHSSQHLTNKVCVRWCHVSWLQNWKDDEELLCCFEVEDDCFVGRGVTEDETWVNYYCHYHQQEWLCELYFGMNVGSSCSSTCLCKKQSPVL